MNCEFVSTPASSSSSSLESDSTSEGNNLVRTFWRKTEEKKQNKSGLLFVLFEFKFSDPDECPYFIGRTEIGKCRLYGDKR